jgi:hypothetical protein
MTQTYPARIVVDADLSCEAPFYTRGARGSEGAQVLHHWARGSDSRGHGDSQARRQERDTMTQRSVRTEVLIFFGLGIGLLLYFFGYVSTKEPVAQLVARVTVSLISVEGVFRDFVAYRAKSRPGIPLKIMRWVWWPTFIDC